MHKLSSRDSHGQAPGKMLGNFTTATIQQKYPFEMAFPIPEISYGYLKELSLNRHLFTSMKRDEMPISSLDLGSLGMEAPDNRAPRSLAVDSQQL